jgi:hypothetical protein
MIPVRPPQPLAPPPGAALVVFVRPSNWAWGVRADVLDETGRFLGQLVPGAHFAAAVGPGRHMFVVWGENTDALAADVLPGHIYFVEGYVTPGAFSAHFHLKAIKPALPNWAMRDTWMRATNQMAVDPNAGQARLNSRGAGNIQERLRRGQEHLARYQGEEQFSRTITPGDGL